ncbi:AAA family ATPase [Streptomyces prasinopilosus]|uniref:AAA family ATPase n=1 Tax=Streptomyces prasinopilosus TaxID=67344 RepID=UPI0006EB3C7F|nr:AAA family ATPase [Streptomyces prasinopilosus]
MDKAAAYAATTGVAPPEQQAPAAREACGTPPAPAVRDLRERVGRSPHALLFGPRDLVVVTGLPGSGKSTLMRRTVRGTRIDSQDTRDRWDRGTPRLLPYAVYRPLVRLAHYAGLRRALRTGEGVVVHDCGTQAWVRRWLAREARRRGADLHLLLLDVPPEQALDGQRARGRGVSRYAFRRHRTAVDRLLASVTRGDLPAGCGSVVLADRDAANTLHRIDFTDRAAH